jgi:glycosyltransferase involved in cell wall biosynthesis
MRVLQLGRFWNDGHGGIERHAALLCRGLAARGAEVVNLVAAVPGQPHSDRQHDGYRLVQARSFGLFARTALSPALIWNALALQREKPFDIVHLHFPDPLSHLVALLLPRTVKVVITWHSDIVRQKLLLRLYGYFQRNICRRADAVVAATRAHLDSSAQIPRDIPASRLHVIPYGLDYSGLELTPRTAALCGELRASTAGRPIVFALGRHIYYKGFDVLVEAMQRVNACAFIGGDGPLRPTLEAQAEDLGLGDKIRFIGRIAEEDLAAYFHACDVFCLPSTEIAEAFGLVQIEAMACGRPVVCTQLHNGVNTANPHEVTGLTVPARDPVALAQALNRLLGDGELRTQMGARGIERVHDVYSLSGMADNHLALYRRLLGAG